MAEEKAAVTRAVTSTVDPGTSYLEWGAIFGGATIAGSISVILLQFGAGAGLAMGSPTLPDGGASWNVLVAGLWLAVVALASASAGGYIAGRMRSRRDDAVESEVEFRDGTHGLTVWAVSTLTVALLMAVITALSAIGSVAAVAGTDVEASADVVRLTANVSNIFNFATAAGSALGAAAAWFAATLGGQHRDEGLSVHEIVPASFRRRAV